MNEVASLDLCKELYKLSGWKDDISNSGKWWWKDSNKEWIAGVRNSFSEYPAYSLGYLLRKLPKGSMFYKGKDFYSASTGNSWVYRDFPFVRVVERATTPENATAKLAIELFKQGVLKDQRQKNE